MHIRIALTTALLAGVMLMHGCSNGPSTEIIAHRGASKLYPENTLLSSRKGWELGAEGVEIDIQLTKDGRVVLLHDGTTKRTTGIELKPSETDAAKLRELDAGSWKHGDFAGEKIPFLEEVMDIIPKKQLLFIEVKSGMDVVPAMCDIVKESGKTDRVVVISFNFEACTETKKRLPDVPVYWLTSTKKDEATGTFAALDPAILERVADAGLDGVDAHYAGIDKAFVDASLAAGMGVYAWTVNDAAEAKRLVGLGVDGITTDRPAWLREQLK